jgi:hypothetical protein
MAKRRESQPVHALFVVGFAGEGAVFVAERVPERAVTQCIPDADPQRCGRGAVMWICHSVPEEYDGYET